MDINQIDLSTALQTMSLTVFLLYAWNEERKERKASQERYTAHLEAFHEKPEEETER